jgi:hypothetical protein
VRSILSYVISDTVHADSGRDFLVHKTTPARKKRMDGSSTGW